MTKKEIEKIIDYLSIKGCFSSYFKGYAKMYAMTTENISGFINKYDLKNKKVLTVAGSGDQRLNCLLRGASEVVCFDTNPLADLQLRLKDTAIQRLSHDEFLKFFGVRNKKSGHSFLDKNTFDKIKYYLDEDVYLLYDFIINEFRGRPFKDTYNDYDFEYGYMTELSNYISKDNYRRMPELIENNKINFLDANIGSLSEMLDGEKFDIILLSNISDYIHYFYGDDHMKAFKEIIDKLVNNLYDGGIMEVAYIYDENEYKDSKRYDDYSKFHIEQSRNKYFSPEEYPIQKVKGFHAKNPNDRIVTYQKKI